MDISKKDWKLFQEKLPSWQENYMQKLVKEYAEYLNDDTKKPSKRFWWMEKRIKEDRHHPGAKNCNSKYGKRQKGIVKGRFFIIWIK